MRFWQNCVCHLHSLLYTDFVLQNGCLLLSLFSIKITMPFTSLTNTSKKTIPSPPNNFHIFCRGKCRALTLKNSQNFRTLTFFCNALTIYDLQLFERTCSFLQRASLIHLVPIIWQQFLQGLYITS